MRLSSVALVGVFVAMAAGVCGAVPVDLSTVTVDENGNGSLGTLPLKGEMIADPTSLTGSQVLVYPLPFAVTPGDVVLVEPGTTEPANSDLIRFVAPQVFWNATTDGTIVGAAGLLLFYSDLPKAGETADLADVGVPPAAPNARTFTETGLFGQPYSEGGPNGLVYNPAAGDPGSFGVTYVGLIAAPSYTFISDGTTVPLPSVAWAGLVLMGVLGGWRAVRRHRIST